MRGGGSKLEVEAVLLLDPARSEDVIAGVAVHGERLSRPRHPRPVHGGGQQAELRPRPGNSNYQPPTKSCFISF